MGEAKEGGGPGTTDTRRPLRGDCRRVLGYIARVKSSGGMVPPCREIARELGISVCNVWRVLTILRDSNYIAKDHLHNSYITLVPPVPEWAGLGDAEASDPVFDPLSPLQERALEFIVRFRGQHGTVPSMRQIANEIELNNVGSAQALTRALIKKRRVPADAWSSRCNRKSRLLPRPDAGDAEIRGMLDAAIDMIAANADIPRGDILPVLKRKAATAAREATNA